MTRTLLLIIFGAALGLACAFAMTPRNSIVVGSMPNATNDYGRSVLQGKEIYSFVPDDIINGPSWEPGTELPVDCGEAIGLGLIGLEKTLKHSDLRFEPWILAEVCLLPYDQKKWFWRVTFEKSIGSANGHVSIERIQILIDMKQNVVVPDV